MFPHRALQLRIIGCVPNDVILGWCDAQEVEVIRAWNTGEGLLRLVAIQHPNIILTQEGVLCRNGHTHKHTHATSG